MAVREFLCLDDPPGPFDSLEESRVSHVKYDHHINRDVCAAHHRRHC